MVGDTVLKRCQQSLELSNAASRFLDPPGADTDRKRLALAAVLLAHEHHSGMVSLMATGHASSPAAMLRPIAEAGMAAFWFTYVASRPVIDALDDTNDIPTLGQMIAELDDSPVSLPGISQIRSLRKDLRWTRFHKYTHGGMLQLSRKLDIDRAFSEPENLHHLSLADHFLLAGLSIGTVLYSDPLLEPFIRERFQAANEEAVRTAGAKRVEWPGLPPVPDLG